MAEVGDSPISLEVHQPAKRAGFTPGRKTKAGLIFAGVVALLLVGTLYLQKKAPPQAARLLPESDAIVYFNVAPIRAVSGFGARPVDHDPDYQHFIDATGIEFERDLSQAAFALHRMPNPLGPNGPVAYSSIFVGKFDHTRLSNYLDSISQSKEHYDGRDIYNISIEGRTETAPEPQPSPSAETLRSRSVPVRSRSSHWPGALASWE
jgi:hypothetical protein